MSNEPNESEEWLYEEHAIALTNHQWSVVAAAILVANKELTKRDDENCKLMVSKLKDINTKILKELFG